MRESGIKGLSAIAAFSLAAFLLCDGQAVPGGGAEDGKGGAPVVKIIAPANGSRYGWNSLVSYSIVVTYQGKSTQYQEIPANEVLLTTTSLPDVSAAAGKAGAATPAGLLDIMRSNCVGCHEFKAKAMGPSFAAIAARYPNNQGSIDALSRSIHDGSTGVFGQASMPAHAELREEQLHAIAQWIVKDAAEPGVNYYVGTEGTVRMEAPAVKGPNAGMVLSASYTAPTDHEMAPRGEDSVVVRGR